MLHTIQSDMLRIAVSNTGAELQSIFSKKSNTEYLWQGDPAHWTGRAPILFPLVGGLKNGQYTYDGKVYPLIKHGFARQSHFYRVSEAREDRLVFEYVDNPKTRRVYPFAFSLLIEFVLKGNTLDITYRVVNQSKGEILFSIGAHEAYRCPRNEGEAFDDYYIEFDKADTYESYPVSKNGLLTDYHFPVITDTNHLPLKHALFENDALIFKSIASKKLSIKSKKSTAVVDVTYDAPHLGIWTKVGAPFVCIEPWCGLPDNEDSDGNMSHKEAVNQLEAGGEFAFNHTITIHE